MPQQTNIHNFQNLDLDTLREALIKGFQHPFFDVEKRMFGQQLNDLAVVNLANGVINSISEDSPFKESL